MIAIEERQIYLHTNIKSKQDAIRLVGQLLVESCCIETGYIASMFGREQIANTYLGNGIAIPHGLPQDRELIKKTGVAIVQVPGGVPWNSGESARLIVGIAAKSDEHIEVLRRLTRVLGDQEQVALLTCTSDPRDIIEALTGERPPAAPAQNGDIADYASSFDAVIINKTGLHARPASAFVDLAKSFTAEIRVRSGNELADGKSLISLLQLGVSAGAQIRVSARGIDASAALAALREAIAAGLGDEQEQPRFAATILQGWSVRHAAQTLEGVSASAGLAIGVIRQHKQRAIVVQDAVGAPFTEGNRFQDALNRAQAELNHLYEEVKTRLGSSKAAIFRVHAELLSDPAIIQQTVVLIYRRHRAAWAWQQVIDERVSQLQKLDDPILAGRAVDLSDVGQRVLRHLLDTPAEQIVLPETPCILLADDLTPSDTAVLDPDTILGFCTVRGGPTSHTAILARSLGIPALVGVGNLLLDVRNGIPAILDGTNGRLYVQPGEADLQSARALQLQLKQQQNAAEANRLAPALTSDGYRIEIAANVNRAADAAQAVAAGAEGIGLMRTEFLFLERSSIPSEEEQFEAYRATLQAMQGRPVIIRTLDIGGDKEVPYLNLPKEDNAFLGMRGIRLCLARPDLFLPQLRALYRAASSGSLSIMFPMIATLDDWQQAHALAEQVRQELYAPAVPLGMMVEVPSAAILADQFAQEVDFFSIGTNDLTQYTLAMDRLHPQLAKQTDGLHPAVLRMIDSVVCAARTAGKWVGVCGGIAGEPQGAAILLGLGVSELSVGLSSIATIKAHIRGQSHSSLQRLAQQVLQCRTAAEVRHFYGTHEHRNSHIESRD